MLLERLWGAEPQDQNISRYIVLRKPGDDKFQHRRVPNARVGALLAQEAGKLGYEVYFAPAGFNGFRSQSECVTVPALWLDVDCGKANGYATQTEALDAVVGWCKSQGAPNPTNIISSGRGLHFYWVFDAPVPVEVWRPAAKQFKQALRVAGVKADPSRTADEASIMRVPGTLHLKDPENPLQVRELHASNTRVRLHEISAALPKLGPRAVERTPAISLEWGTDAPLPPGDAPSIATACRQMAHIRDTRGAVDEPLWRAGLSVLKRCEHGDHYIHEWSKGDERYDAAQTQAKADGTVGPFSCQTFDEANPGGCEGCPLKGKITSPIQAGVSAPEPMTPQQQAAEPWRLSKIGQYTCTSGGVWYQPPALEGTEPEPPQKLATFPIWVRQVRERNRLDVSQTQGAAALLHYVTLHGKVAESAMPLTVLFDAREFRNWMAENGLAPGVLGEAAWKKLMVYISELTANVYKNIGLTKYNEAMGWYDDFQTFVVGNRAISGTGATETLLATSQASLNRTDFDPTADGAVWTAAVNSLNRPGRYKHAYAVLCAIASPLSHMSRAPGRNPALLALSGNTGAGKTTAMQLGFSFWCAPEALILGPGSSMNGVTAHLSARRHLPFGVDEITQYAPAKIGQLAYAAVNGTPDVKQTRAGKERYASPWSCTSIVTSNTAIMDYSETQIQAAHRMRINELWFTEADTMDRAEGAMLHDAMLHYGAHAERFVQMLIQTGRKSINKLQSEVEDRIARKYGINQAQRFSLWQMADAWIAGAICKSLGIFDLDLDAIMAVAADAVNGVSDNMTDSETLATNVVAEWLSEHNAHVADWPLNGIMSDPMGRGVPHPIARLLGGGRVAIHRSALNRVLSDAGVARRSAPGLFSPPSRPGDDRRIKLTPDSPAVWCYVFDADALGFDFTPPTEVST